MDNAYTGHIKSKTILNGMELKIPSDKNWFLVTAFTLFILIWLFVEIFIIPGFIFSNIQNGLTSLLWVCGWTACGAFAIRMWLWHTFGQTILSIQNNTLTIRKQNDIFSKQKHYDLDKIQDLHIQSRDIERTKYFVRPNHLFTDKTKTIAFIYEHKTTRAIDWLNMTDANYVFSKLTSNLPV
jgi:hypothetical protein